MIQPNVKKVQSQNGLLNQDSNQFRQLQKTASSPRLIQNRQEEALNNEEKKGSVYT